MQLIKKTALIFTLSISLLTACADTGIESAPPSNISNEVLSDTAESTPQTFEPSTETESSEIMPADTEASETLTETSEPQIINYPPSSQLLYNGEIYTFAVGSRVTEVDGKLYELMENEIIEPFIDAERMKGECEYIGQSIPLPVESKPEHELELASYDSVPCELYKIDENLILVYCTEDFEVPKEHFGQTMFYPGTYRIYSIYNKNAEDGFLLSLYKKYYRYAERFPEQYS